MTRKFILAISIALTILALQTTTPAQSVAFTITEAGYTSGTIILPENVAGALSAHPSNTDVIFASTGSFGAHHVYRIDTTDLANPIITPVITRDIDAIGGIAVIDDTHLVITNNANVSIPAGVTTETILLCHDQNIDGDFDDTDEIKELIAPIKISNPDPVWGLFTGSQAKVVPPDTPGNLPAGAVVVQTADGATSSELLIVTNPTDPGSAAYHPTSDCWFEGFGYNGGIDFHGGVAFTGGAYDGIFALSDLDNSNKIDQAGEQNLIVSPGDLGFYSIYDIAIDAEGDLFATANDFIAGQIQTLKVPGTPLATASQSMSAFVTTDSPFITVIAMNSKTLNFDPPSTGNDAVLFFTANGAGFSNNPDLYWITPVPVPPASVDDWMQF